MLSQCTTRYKTILYPEGFPQNLYFLYMLIATKGDRANIKCYLNGEMEIFLKMKIFLTEYYLKK